MKSTGYFGERGRIKNPFFNSTNKNINKNKREGGYENILNIWINPTMEGK